MADYTKMFRSIWRDRDFLTLPALVQRVYILIITQPTLSSCGVTSLSIKRWATLAPDTDADSVREALSVLVERDYVWIDEDTEEVAARAFMKRDELWKQTQGPRSVQIALTEVLSDGLRCRLEDLAVTLDERFAATLRPSVEPHQQQQQQHEPEQQQQPPSNPAGPLGDPDRTGAAADALEMFIKHKCRTEDVRNVKRYSDRLRRDLPTEHGEALAAYLATNPDANGCELAVKVLGLRTVDLAHIGATS